MWTHAAIRNHASLSGDILQMKVLQFNSDLGDPQYPNFKASDGWISSFKKRADIRNYKIHSESANTPIYDLSEHRENLQEDLSEYNLEDIFNADETRLYYRMTSN